MSNKFWQWFAAAKEADQHLDNAASAGVARAEHLPDIVNGVERVVDRHLERIASRELALCEFAEHIAESPVFDNLNDQDFDPRWTEGNDGGY